MEWFKHKTGSLDDPDFNAILDEFGSDGYMMFFGLLEIYGKEFSNTDSDGFLNIRLAFVARKLRKSSVKVRKFLSFCEKSISKPRFVSHLNSPVLRYKVPDFIDMASNWTKRKSKTPTEAPTEAPTAIRSRSKKKKEKKKDTPCPHLKIIEIYHRKLPMLPVVQSHTEDLKKRLRARWREDPQRQNLEWWEGYFEYVSKSNFLVGKVKSWGATFFWLIGPQNMTKVLNGEYTNRGKDGQKIVPTTYAQAQDAERRLIAKTLKEMKKGAGKSKGDSGGAPQVEHILPGGEEVLGGD